MRGRNDYAYRHDRIAEADLRGLFIATTKPYNGLGKVILSEEPDRYDDPRSPIPLLRNKEQL